MQERKKQIEEMAKVIHDVAEAHHIIWCTELAKILYNAGYRKQSEGEWKRSERSKYDYFCTACGEKAVQNIYGNHDRLFKFCPNCGAKMKGGKE